MDGKELKRIRKHLRLTQVQWAKVCRVRRQTVSEWENSADDIDGPVEPLAILLRNEPARIVELSPEWNGPMPPAIRTTEPNAPEVEIEDTEIEK